MSKSVHHTLHWSAWHEVNRWQQATWDTSPEWINLKWHLLPYSAGNNHSFSSLSPLHPKLTLRAQPWIQPLDLIRQDKDARQIRCNSDARFGKSLFFFVSHTSYPELTQRRINGQTENDLVIKGAKWQTGEKKNKKIVDPVFWQYAYCGRTGRTAARLKGARQACKQQVWHLPRLSSIFSPRSPLSTPLLRVIWPAIWLLLWARTAGSEYTVVFEFALVDLQRPIWLSPPISHTAYHPFDPREWRRVGWGVR